MPGAKPIGQVFPWNAIIKQATAVAKIVAVNTAPKSKKPLSVPANSPEENKGIQKHYVSHRKKSRYTSNYFSFKICFVFSILKIFV
jgi:hypothetical protein